MIFKTFPVWIYLKLLVLVTFGQKVYKSHLCVYLDFLIFGSVDQCSVNISRRRDIIDADCNFSHKDWECSMSILKVKGLVKQTKKPSYSWKKHLSFQNGTVEVLKSNIIKEVFKKGLISVTISSDKGSISSELVDY